MATDLTRRAAIGAIAAATALAALPAAALNDTEAKALINQVVTEINTVINSGRSETQMFDDFERIFVKYSDVPVIARSALGVAARAASAAQMAAFTKAFQGYISRKYGRRFREFIGGRIEVIGAKQVNSFYEVDSTAYLQGQSPFDLRWQVSDKSGRNLFFNLIIEGVNMLASERTEIGAMLDKRGGNLNAMIEDLKAAG